jgi:tellurite resistance protein TehA-like permease
MNERVRHFPITSFAVVMGLTGLTIALGRGCHEFQMFSVLRKDQ